VPHWASDVPLIQRVKSATSSGILSLARRLELVAIVMDRPEVAWVVSAAMGQRHDVVDLCRSTYSAKPNALLAAA